jgi:hypothetical protein
VGSALARWSSQSPSPHSYRDVNTTDAVAGGCSARLAIGSALRRSSPSGPRISNLYLVPSATPGTNSSHTPAPPSERIG